MRGIAARIKVKVIPPSTVELIPIEQSTAGSAQVEMPRIFNAISTLIGSTEDSLTVSFWVPPKNNPNEQEEMLISAAPDWSFEPGPRRQTMGGTWLTYTCIRRTPAAKPKQPDTSVFDMLDGKG